MIQTTNQLLYVLGWKHGIRFMIFHAILEILTMDVYIYIPMNMDLLFTDIGIQVCNPTYDTLHVAIHAHYLPLARWRAIINHSFGNGLYHLLMVNLGMVYSQ